MSWTRPGFPGTQAVRMGWMHESRMTLKLAFPLMIGQLSQMLLGVADTVMVGHLGVTELAALTFANTLFHVPFVFGMGVLTAVSVFSSNARGGENADRAVESCRNGAWLALGLGLVLFAGAMVLSEHLHVFGQPAEVTERAKVFFRILMASMVPGLVSIALKNHADALNRPWPSFWIFLGGVVLNIVLNALLIHGLAGFPELGFEGAAWATLIARVMILVGMFVWFAKSEALSGWVPLRWSGRPGWSGVRRLASMGFPASIQMLCEVSAFSVAGLLMGRFGKDALAAHQIAITLAATAFMIPLGLSMALTVRIGEALGAGEFQRFRRIAVSGWLLVTGYALLAAGFFLICGEWLASLFVGSPEVVALGASLLVIVGVFQVVDGLQVASSAMLRGLQDARVPALMGFTAYWLVGLPTSAWLAFSLGIGAPGVWWGLAAGLFVACVTLGPRLWKRAGRAIAPS